MNANPAFHTQTSVNPKAGAVECVPCSPDFDRGEARRYNGVSAAVLCEHAKDIVAIRNEQSRREGTGARFYARETSLMAVAVWAYMTVKKALALLAAPLRNKSFCERAGARHNRSHPKAPTVWLTKPPTPSEWAQKDTEVGYDLRGTSPTWVMRRVYQHRTRRRRELEPPHERAYRLGQEASRTPSRTAEFIGPPMPRHYKDVDDLHMIWPPIELPIAPKGCLPHVSEAPFVDADVCESLAPEVIEHMDTLVDGYNFAREQFGEDATYNFLRGLTGVNVSFMDAYIAAYSAYMRKFAPRKRAPP